MESNDNEIPPLGHHVQEHREVFKISDDVPSTAQVHEIVPKHCFERSVLKSSWYALWSLSLTIAVGFLAWKILPLSYAAIPLWLVYAFVNGTIATGVWVVAHECGHGAFCESVWLRDSVGFVLHSALLVPYFSWQRSHAVHHLRTNHTTEGETHVPHEKTSRSGQLNLRLHDFLGDDAFAVWQLLSHLLLGWPFYLLFGVTGSPKRGMSNHFLPTNPELFPEALKHKVIISSIGVGAMAALLWNIGRSHGFVLVAALYGGPYLVANGWLVLYTWLQHTDVDIPHYDEKHWTWMKGAFATVDRAYPFIFDILHHHIGTTHVLHHVISTIPHYHAQEASIALSNAFPHLCLNDPTPIPAATWRVAKHCYVTAKMNTKYFFVAPDTVSPKKLPEIGA